MDNFLKSDTSLNIEENTSQNDLSGKLSEEAVLVTDNEMTDNANYNATSTTTTTTTTSTANNLNNECSSLMNNYPRIKLSQAKKSSTKSSTKSSNLSKSIDSCDSFKQKKEQKLTTTKSVDLDRVLDKRNPNLIIVNNALFSPQRSIDYPCIVRKTPKLSDIVRKRLLFQKVSRGATLLGESFSSSMEKEHVPKAPRKIIIRQDNSIEISLTRPPKLRRQTFSEDFAPTNFNPLNEPGNEMGAMSALAVKNPSMLSVSSTGNDRRKTIETCENIFLQSEESTKLRARTPPSNPHRILLYKDKSDKSIRSNYSFKFFSE